MGNRITRTVLFAVSALLSMCAFGAGAARFGTLRNSDWVVTNAWQAVSNKTHDLILEIGQGGSLPPNWQSVSNAAMNSVSKGDFATATNDIYGTLSDIKTDRITDGTNTIDAAGIVYTNDIQIGKLALTNDIPPSVAVVAPTANAVSGQAADAKATGTALFTGFTEWEFTWDGEHGTWEPDGSVDFYDGTWTQIIINGTELDIAQVTAGADATRLEFHFNFTGLSATTVRHLVTPTKTSQLTNDGSNGVPFAVITQIPEPVDIGTKVSTNALAGQSYDFSRNYDIIKATADLIRLLGGTVTNNPTGGN